MVSLGSVWTLLWSKMLLSESLTQPKFMAVGMIVSAGP
jgi:hypothetical protein